MKTKIRELISFQRVIAFVALVVLIVVSSTGPLIAQTFTQGYGTDGLVQKGMIVRLAESDTSKVQALSPDEMDKMHGVVVSANDAAVTLSDIAAEKVFVATRGRYDVLVSSQNGDIKEGDLITLSAVKGVGMKVDDKQPFIVGRAVGTFDKESRAASTTKLKDSSGGDKEVRIGRVQAEINVGRNPLLKGEESSLPGFLQKVSESIAGRPVDANRVYIGMVVFLLTTSVAGSLIYAGVRSGIISIGRNPFSKKLILRGMFQVIVVGLIIFILGIFGVYLLLKL
jgi:hypothetical protein